METIYAMLMPLSILIAAVTRKDLAIMSAVVIVASEAIYATNSDPYQRIVAWSLLNTALAVLAAQHYRKTRSRLAVVVGWIAAAGVANVAAMAVCLNTTWVLEIIAHFGGILTMLLLTALVFMDGSRDFTASIADTVHRSRTSHGLSHRHRSDK